MKIALWLLLVLATLPVFGQASTPDLDAWVSPMEEELGVGFGESTEKWSGDPLDEPKLSSKGKHQALMREGGQLALGARFMEILNTVPKEALRRSEKKYQLGDKTFTPALALSMALEYKLDLYAIIKRLDKDDFKLGKARSEVYSRALNRFFKEKVPQQKQHPDVVALRKFFRTPGAQKSPQETAFYKEVAQVLLLIPKSQEKCALVVFDSSSVGASVSSAEDRQLAGFFLSCRGYEVQ